MFARMMLAIPVVAAVLLFSAGTALAQESHTVQPGDTLSHIADTHNVSGGWPALYERNRGVVGGNPHLIYPGQVLALGGGEKTEKAKPAKPKAKAKRRTAGDTATSKVRPATGGITSSFGMRTHPITGIYKLHSGTDYSYGNGRAYAAAAGVAEISWPDWAGNLITIRHGGGVQTRYAHLAEVWVSQGERVTAGQAVGLIGERGLATGAHLHFEVLIRGEFINPERWLQR